jgi:hypothetical protein
MTTAKWTSIQEHTGFTPRTTTFNQKSCLQVWGGDALRTPYKKFSKIWHITPHNCPSNTKSKFRLIFIVSVAMPSSPHGVVFPPLKSHRYGILSMPYGFPSCQEWGKMKRIKV